MSSLPLIIEAHELTELLDAQHIIILDLRDEASYAAAHIPGAIQFSLSELVSTAPPVGGLLPSEAQASQALSRIGYQTDKHVVAIDDNGGPQAARLLWTLGAFGIDSASMLNGGMSAWLTEISVTEKSLSATAPSQYQASFQGDNCADRSYIQKQLGSDNIQLLDARTPGEYNGADLRSARGGHIPGAILFNWVQIKSPDMKFKPLEEIGELLEAAGFRKDKEVIAYCQTHMRSSVIWVLLKALGYKQAKGYPGAWSDWGNQTDTPVE